jgi:hypothetical protein
VATMTPAVAGFRRMRNIQAIVLWALASSIVANRVAQSILLARFSHEETGRVMDVSGKYAYLLLDDGRMFDARTNSLSGDRPAAGPPPIGTEFTCIVSDRLFFIAAIKRPMSSAADVAFCVCVVVVAMVLTACVNGRYLDQLRSCKQVETLERRVEEPTT